MTNLVIILTKVTITLGFCSTPNWVMLPVNTLLTDIFPQMMILRKETNFLLRSPCPKLFEFFMKSCPSPFSSITQASLRYWLKVTYCWLSNMLGACEHQASLIPLSSCALTSMESSDFRRWRHRKDTVGYTSEHVWVPLSAVIDLNPQVYTGCCPW